jgi:hypothetical protein
MARLWTSRSATAKHRLARCCLVKRMHLQVAARAENRQSARVFDDRHDAQAKG